MRKTKTVYSFDDNGVFVGTDIAFESWDLDGTFLLPANSTEVEVPNYDSNSERALWSEDLKSWRTEKITQENTPKPEYNAEYFDLEWNLNHWETKQKPLATEENTPKPDYDSKKYFLKWALNHWEVKEIPTQENTPKPEYDPSTHELEWSKDRWELILKPTQESVRSERNYLLSQTDWIFAPDVSLKNKEAWLTYRQALRDLPQNFSDPSEVVWPDKPE